MNREGQGNDKKQNNLFVLALIKGKNPSQSSLLQQNRI